MGCSFSLALVLMFRHGSLGLKHSQTISVANGSLPSPPFSSKKLQLIAYLQIHQQCSPDFFGWCIINSQRDQQNSQ